MQATTYSAVSNRALSEYTRLAHLRTQDTTVRTAVEKALAGSKEEANITVTYTLGSDGKKYATDATITTNKKIKSREDLDRESVEKAEERLNEESGEHTVDFQQILQASFELAPVDQVTLFNENVVDLASFKEEQGVNSATGVVEVLQPASESSQPVYSASQYTSRHASNTYNTVFEQHPFYTDKHLDIVA
jgi:hypothetical protein